MNAFNSFPSIESFHRVRKDMADFCREFGITEKVIEFRGKVKLHGTNAGIVIEPTCCENRRVLAQSRSQIISVGNDNAGFASWLETSKDVWLNSFSNDTQPITIFGEWCGQSIQKGVAISHIGKKIFAIFAVQIGKSDDDDSKVIVDPVEIRNMLPDSLPENVYILPWDTEMVGVDFADLESVNYFVGVCNYHVERVEPCDPWVYAEFGVSGTGEGVVFYPVSMEDETKCILRRDFRNYTFKAKGEKHKVVKTKKSVQIDPEIATTIDEFAAMVVTEARLNQAVTEAANGTFDTKFVGPVIGWVSKDVRKDVDNREIVLPENTEWKMINTKITILVRNWYIEKSKTL